MRADHKESARLSVIRHLVQILAPPDVRTDYPPPDPDILFPFEESALVDGRLAKFKLPKRVIFVAELPRNSMGKVQKSLLREEFAGLYGPGYRA